MSTVAPQCRTVTVYTFRGDRSDFEREVRKKLDDQQHGQGAGPSTEDCLLYAGHTGVSTDAGKTIHGFNPDFGTLQIWVAMQHLRSGGAFPGVVLDDTAVFTRADQQGLRLLTFDVILPDPGLRVFQNRLKAERKKSKYSYGFPNGDGDCNCTTWLERLALGAVKK